MAAILLRACRVAPNWTLSTRSFATSRVGFRSAGSPVFNEIKSRVAVKSIAAPSRHTGVLAAVATVGLGLSIFYQKPISCDGGPTASATPAPPREPLPPPPASTVNVYELSFGTVCGICAGVFLKKGAKALAFIFGGIFVLLQYFTSISLTKVDWGRVASRFEKLFYSPPTEPGGAPRPPTVASLWNWFVNFLTADFQQRASFLAGFALGLRIG